MGTSKALGNTTRRNLKKNKAREVLTKKYYNRIFNVKSSYKWEGNSRIF